ncbi:MAG TPA: FTR1 family protein [Methylocella sp.]|nr:FTR1 family protein [Methylocella sp.]
MGAALVITLREVIEAGLIIGVVLAMTRGVPKRARFIGAGVLFGLVGAVLTAAFAGVLSTAFAGAGQEVFNASVLGLAVILLAWHNVWMAHHGRKFSEEMRRFGDDLASGNRSLIALAIIVGLAVLREGFEVVLFLYGIILSSGTTGLSLLIGGAAGLLLGAAVSGLAYCGLAIIPTRHFFKVTSILITFMAAGMAAQSVAFLEQADIATALGATLWNTASVLADNSIPGRFFHALFGYTSQPTELQMLVYLMTLVTIFTLMKCVAPSTRRGHRLAVN